MRTLDVWYARLDVEELVGAGAEREREGSASGSSATSRRRARKDSLRAFGKLTELVDGEPRIVSDPPVIVPIEELARASRPSASRTFMRG